MDQTFEKLYANIGQGYFMLRLGLLTLGLLCVCLCIGTCSTVFPCVSTCLLRARPSVVMMHIFHEVASCVPPALKARAANQTLLMRMGNIKIPNDQNRPRYDPADLVFPPSISVHHKFLI